MFKRWRLPGVAIVLLCGVALPMAARTGWAQSKAVELWVDTRTHQVFTEWGPHRVRLNLPGTITEDQLNREVDERVQEKTAAIQTQLSQQQAASASLAQQNSALTQQVTAMKPDWKSYAQGFAKNMHIGTVTYADYGFYTHTAFGPAWEDNLNQPGQGNNNFNTFDLTRAYINFMFTPTKDLLLRFTPDVYRTIGATNDKFGQTGAIGTTLDGDLGVRLKYGYIQWKNFFDGNEHTRGA